MMTFVMIAKKELAIKQQQKKTISMKDCVTRENIVPTLKKITMDSNIFF